MLLRLTNCRFIIIYLFITSCCLVVGLGLGLYFVSGWLVVTHTYLSYFPLSLSLSHFPQSLSCFPFSRPQTVCHYRENCGRREPSAKAAAASNVRSEASVKLSKQQQRRRQLEVISLAYLWSPLPPGPLRHWLDRKDAPASTAVRYSANSPQNPISGSTLLGKRTGW